MPTVGQFRQVTRDATLNRRPNLRAIALKCALGESTAGLNRFSGFRGTFHQRDDRIVG